MKNVAGSLRLRMRPNGSVLRILVRPDDDMSEWSSLHPFIAVQQPCGSVMPYRIFGEAEGFFALRLSLWKTLAPELIRQTKGLTGGVYLA